MRGTNCGPFIPELDRAIVAGRAVDTATLLQLRALAVRHAEALKAALKMPGRAPGEPERVKSMPIAEVQGTWDNLRMSEEDLLRWTPKVGQILAVA